MAGETPPAEVHIDEALVRALLRDQHAELAERSLVAVESGWDNAMFRLGDDLAVRLPRRKLASPLIEKEQAWLPILADWLPVRVPVPLRTGSPGQGYPYSWSVVSWLEGDPADRVAPHASEASAFADFMLALHRRAPDDAPRNPYRGVPLRDREDSFRERAELLTGEAQTIFPQVFRIWERALVAPLPSDPIWLHGDLHPRNILVSGGCISGVIDWGDFGAGDPATDLASVWMLFDDPGARSKCLDHYGAADDLLLRAKGWAVFFGVMLASIVDDPYHAVTGSATLRRLASEIR